MPVENICFICGATLSPRVSGGQCPKCLLRLAWSAHPEEAAGGGRKSEVRGQQSEISGQKADVSDQKTQGAPRDDSAFRPPTSDLCPSVFGDYELGSEIARGGMGVVYRARQISLDRTVALKMIARGEFASPALVHRFQIEAGAAARLDHPHIVPIYEIGEHRGQVYYSMKLVEGGDLAAKISNPESPISNREAAQLLSQIAEAIHYAHQRGVLHRDLKPSNILIGADGSPRVTDFGLAKLIEDESGLTLSTAALGTPAYMAPEQAAGRSRQVSTAADIYSLGAILYELLTGRPPFQAESALATMRKVVEEDPLPPRAVVRKVIAIRCSVTSKPSNTRRRKTGFWLLDTDHSASIAPDLETICLKCLEKEPGKRYGTAQDLAEDLDRFLRNEPIHARPIGPTARLWRWCRRKPALASLGAATLVLLLAIAIGSPIAIYRINHERQRAERGELDARQKAYASDMRLAQQAVQEDDFSRALQLLDRHRPKGKSEMGNLKSEMGKDLRGWEWRYLWRQCQGEERFILGKHVNGATAVGLLADGKTVFSAGGDKLVRLWDLESRRQIGLLPHREAVIGAAASRDGRWLATASMKEAEGQPVLLWDLATQKITATLTTNFWLRPGSITFSPDNKWLAFDTPFGGVRIWDVNARREVTNLPASSTSITPRGLAFSPDSRTLAYNEDEYGAIPLWDVASRSIDRLTGHQSAVTALAFSPDGQTLASGSDDRTARLWNLADRRERMQFTNHSGGFSRLAFSPDGRTLAMTGEGGAGRIIRLVDVATGNQKAELRGHLKGITSLAFTPDGQTLLSASHDGSIRVWNLLPSAKEKSAFVFARNSINTDWSSYGPALCLSPDGRHLLTVYTNQIFSVWDTLRLAEGKRYALPFTNTTIAAVASGGRVAAFASRRGQVMLWDVETGQAQFSIWPVTNRIRLLVFSPDGRCLAADDEFKTPSEMAGSNDDKRRTVRVWDVGARRETHVLSTDGEFPVSLTFSADARALMAGFWRGPVKLWPLDRADGTATFPGHSGEVHGLALLPDGQTLLSAGADADIRFWDVRTRRETDQLNPREGGFSSLALSPDGRRFAAGASDGLITIWDIASHQELATLEGHKAEVRHLAFTPDGDHLVSVSKDQLRVWSAASPAEADAATELEARK